MPEVSAAGYMQPQPFPSDLRLHGVDGTVVEGLRFTLTRVVLHEVSGRVVTESGPVEGASVEWRGFEGEFPRTNALGQFQVQLPDTVERLTVRHPCCRLKIQELGKPQEVEIVLVKHDARAELLKRALSGVVVDEDDRPVSGAVVSILSESGRKLTSDPQGRFSTEVQGLTVWLIATKGTATSETIDFVDSEVRVRLVTNDAAFSGRVVDQQGEPVRQFELHLRDKSGGWTVTVFSPDGTYVIEGQHAGGYKVSISGPEFPESESRNFVLGRGLKLQGVDFRLQRGVTISGHVYAEKTGERLQGVLIRSGRQVARSDADGGFQLLGLSPGRQELGADKNDFLHRDIPVTAPGVVAIGLRPQTTSGSDYEGAGLRLDFSRTLRVGEGYPVMALHPEGGARVAGILPGDELLAAEGVAAGTLGTNEFNERIRGAEGSIVKLTVRRDGRVFDVNVVRRRLVWQRQE